MVDFCGPHRTPRKLLGEPVFTQSFQKDLEGAVTLQCKICCEHIHSNLDITDPHNPPIFSTVYRRYVMPVLRTEYVIWNQYITHLQQFASQTGRNKTIPISEIHVKTINWYEIIDVLGIILKP